MFLLLKGELENRLDPLFYSENIFSFLKITTFEVKKIREINTFVKAGFGVGRQDQDLEQNGYIQIRPTNLDEDGFLKFDKNIYLSERYLETNKANILEKEDVLFNNTNSQELVGKTAYFEEEGIFLHSNHITIIRVNKEIILPKYLWILLNIYQKRKIFFNICTNWNNQSGVGIDRLLSLKIPVPNLETQQTIINIFEKAYALKKANEEKAKALLASIDDYLLAELGIVLPKKVENTLKNRVFLRNITELSGGRFDSFYYQNEFTKFDNVLTKSESIKFGDLIDVITKGETPTWRDEDFSSDGILFLKVQNISISGLRGELDFISKKLHQSMKRSILKGGEILYSMAGTIGIAMIYDKNEEANINQAIAKIQLKNEFDQSKIFIVEILNSKICLRQAQRFLTVSAQPNINFEQIKSLQIPFPSISKQKEIADHITNIRQQAKTLQNEAKTAIEEAKRTVEAMILGQ